jgi:hypothetical protein
MSRHLLYFFIVLSAITACGGRNDQKVVEREPPIVEETSFVSADSEFATMYVAAESTDMFLCPDGDCPVTNTVYYGQLVDVFEERNSWSRVSEYYDASSERAEFPSISDATVARWVRSNDLTDVPPTPKDELSADQRYFDERIQGISKPGEYGLTEDDILLIRRYAYGMLATGQCDRIEYGDKSVSKPNTYFVNCGEAQNRFFTPSDVKAEW